MTTAGDQQPKILSRKPLVSRKFENHP